MEFKSLQDPLCEDDTYHERIDIISNRWSFILNRIQKSLNKLKVSITRILLIYL